MTNIFDKIRCLLPTISIFLMVLDLVFIRSQNNSLVIIGLVIIGVIYGSFIFRPSQLLHESLWYRALVFSPNFLLALFLAYSLFTMIPE
jgi:hypothetical protein